MFVEDYNYLTYDDADTISGSITDQADSDFSTLSGTLSSEINDLSDSDHNHNDALVDTKFINLYDPVSVSGGFHPGDHISWASHTIYDDTVFFHTISGSTVTVLASGIYDITYNVDFENLGDTQLNFILGVETNGHVIDYSKSYGYNIGITDVYFSMRRKFLYQFDENDYFRLQIETTNSGSSGSSSFYYLTTPIDVTPDTINAWTDVDVSSNVPEDTTGVILQVVNSSASTDYQFGVRKNGSTDTFMPAWGGGAVLESHVFYMTGVDTSSIFEVFTGSITDVTVYLMGYTDEGVYFFTNAPDKSLATTGSYQEVDISSDTGTDIAIGAIFTMKNNSATSYLYSIRKKGSTDNRYADLDGDGNTVVLIGVDYNEIVESQIENTSIDMFLTGYIKNGAVFFTNAKDVSQNTVGSYVDTDITSHIGTDDASGAFLENSSSTNYLAAVRKNGASYDYYNDIKHNFLITAVDDSNIFEQKIENVAQDLFMVGYSTNIIPPTTLTDVEIKISSSMYCKLLREI